MIYRVRDFAYLDGPKGDPWASPGQYIRAANPEAVDAFLEKSGQTHKVIQVNAVPQGASLAGVPAELCNVRVIGGNRAMPEPAVVKRGPGRPRKVQSVPANGEDHED